MVMSGRSANLTTLFVGRLRPPKRLTSPSCTYFRQLLTTVLLESVEGETKVCGRTRYRTRDLWLLNRTRYRLRFAARQDTSQICRTGRKNLHKMLKLQQIFPKLYRCLLYVVFQNLKPQNAGLVDVKKDLNSKRSKGIFVRENLKNKHSY